MVCSCGQYLLPYRALLEQVLERGRHLACPEGAELTSELLLSVLTALLAVYITDHGGLRGRLADPQQRHLIVRVSSGARGPGRALWGTWGGLLNLT